MIMIYQCDECGDILTGAAYHCPYCRDFFCEACIEFHVNNCADQFDDPDDGWDGGNP